MIDRSEKLATYDINKDEKFAYLKELMRFEKNGIDITKANGEKPEKAKFRRKSLAVYKFNPQSHLFTFK